MIKIKHNLFLLSLICLVGIITSCDKPSLYSETKVFNNHVWKQKHKPEFSVEIKDTTKTYDFVLDIRTTTDYEYSNLWMYFTIDGPAGKTRKFPIEVVTAKPNGEWTGKKTGTVVSFSKLLIHDKFPKKGKYKLIFEQGITKKNLNEVIDITLNVFEAKQVE